jgi:hypothetical protein
MRSFHYSLIFIGWLITLVATAQEAGWINHFDGQPENYQLKRGEQLLPVTFLQILQVGDAIEVKNKQDVVTLNLVGGTQLFKVTVENSPFQVKPGHQVPASLESQWSWIKEQLNRWHQLTESLNFEDDKSTMLSMPLLANLKKPATLVAGQRALHLQWYGGKSPYLVQVKQRREDLWQVMTEKARVETTPIIFEAGHSYRVIIIDAAEQKFIGGFRVVDANEIPSYPVFSSPNQEIDEIYQTLLVSWLAAQEGGMWRFEAFQRIAQISNSVAELLRQALAKGGEKQALRGVRG